MKYFVRDCIRTSTVYHEFQKGYFDVHFDLKLSDLFLKVMPNFNGIDEIEVIGQHWERIMA